MNLDEAKAELATAAKLYAQDGAAGWVGLAKAAVAFADARRAESKPTQAREANGVTLPFGKEKGVPLNEAKKHNLEWVLGVVKTSIDDPAKERYRDDNTRLAAAIERELSTR